MRIIKLFLAIAYLLSPVDLLPEILIGPFGLIDDVGALIYMLDLLIVGRR